VPWSALLSTWCDRREHWLFPAPTATTMLFLIAAGSLYAHDLRACSEEVNLMQTRASGAAEATPATMLVLPCAAGLSQHRQLQPGQPRSSLSLVSSVISTAALGLTSVMSTPSRSPRKHLRAVLGDLSHHATMLIGPGRPHLRGPRPGPPRQAALCLREFPKKTTPPGMLWYSSIPNLRTPPDRGT